MSRQAIFGSPKDKFKKKLFVDNGLGYEEVRAQIIEPYGAPIPQPNAKELKMINAPSHIQTMGLSSYKITLVLLFESKLAYSDYMSVLGFGHKFYDERGLIYTGAVESIKSTPVEANNRYKAEVGLILIKKDQQDIHKEIQSFQDTDSVAVTQLSKLGVIPTFNQYGDPVLYFYPSAVLNRGEFALYLVRTKRLIEQMLRE